MATDLLDSLPAEQRRLLSVARRALAYRAPLRMTPHRDEGGAELPAASCARGWEGLIAKRADGHYQPRRSGDWLKAWTRDGMLRHPRYLGLRNDRAAEEVVRERPSGRAAG
ncbi:hypothetical protein [Streptomyces sp. NBC_01614]|uniref:hypothetical protein n=1 Tax=Streptomyces sp. NBC_01614 TaxID=2975897 RepID=UPI00387058C9